MTIHKNRRPHRATVYRAADGRWHYRVKSGNGRIVDDSEQGFRQRRSCMNRLITFWPHAEVTVEG